MVTGQSVRVEKMDRKYFYLHVSTLVDQVTNSLQVWTSIGDVGL